MKFTDEDLKRLKNWVEYAKDKGGINVMREMYLSEMEPLLARLEAAERLADKHSGHDDDCDELSGDICSCGFSVDEIAWIKACDK